MILSIYIYLLFLSAAQSCMDAKQVLHNGHCYLFSGYPKASWATAKQVSLLHSPVMYSRSAVKHETLSQISFGKFNKCCKTLNTMSTREILVVSNRGFTSGNNVTGKLDTSLFKWNQYNANLTRYFYIEIVIF